MSRRAAGKRLSPASTIGDWRNPGRYAHVQRHALDKQLTASVQTSITSDCARTLKEISASDLHSRYCSVGKATSRRKQSSGSRAVKRVVSARCVQAATMGMRAAQGHAPRLSRAEGSAAAGCLNPHQSYAPRAQTRTRKPPSYTARARSSNGPSPQARAW
ncbi:unnamed protein product, partial [Iphiclides podalirius]